MLSKDAKWGWEIARHGKRVSSAKVLTWDRGGNSPYKVVAISDTGAIYIGCEDGLALCNASGDRLWDLDLRDAPAPKATGVDWIVRRAGNEADGYVFLAVDEGEAWRIAHAWVRDGFKEVAYGPFNWTEGMGLEAEGGE